MAHVGFEQFWVLFFWIGCATNRTLSCERPCLIGLLTFPNVILNHDKPRFRLEKSACCKQRHSLLIHLKLALLVPRWDTGIY